MCRKKDCNLYIPIEGILSVGLLLIELDYGSLI